MKEREKKVLDFIIERERVSLKELLDEFKISKRTLYYDIKSLNYELAGSGRIENLDHKFTYSGSYSSLIDEDLENKDKFIDAEYRRNYIIYEILGEAVKKLIEKGVEVPPIFYSANLDGGDDLNKKFYEAYKESIHYEF